MKYFILRKLIPWLLLLVSALFIASGFGITQTQTVQKLTFGLLTKPLSFSLHSHLVIPFLVLLVLHTAVVIGVRWRKSKKS